MKNPDDYARELICPRCGDGWPVCAELVKTEAKGMVRTMVCDYTCGRYRYAPEVCHECQDVMDWEDQVAE